MGISKYQAIDDCVYTWKLLTASGGCASPAAEVGHSRPAEDWTEPGDMESSEGVSGTRVMPMEFRIRTKKTNSF